MYESNNFQLTMHQQDVQLNSLKQFTLNQQYVLTDRVLQLFQQFFKINRCVS